MIGRYYDDIPINHTTGISNLTQWYIEVSVGQLKKIPIEDPQMQLKKKNGSTAECCCVYSANMFLCCCALTGSGGVDRATARSGRTLPALLGTRRHPHAAIRLREVPWT